jgi:hypothetical protein
MKKIVTAGKLSSNFRTEVETLEIAATVLMTEKQTEENVLLLSNALPVITDLKSTETKDSMSFEG